MMVYFDFYHDKGWHPRDVDQLYDDEQYWLPVLEAACNEAEAAWAAVKEG